MKAPKLNTPWDYDQDLETPKGASMTQPDQALTVRELFERMSLGQELSVNQNFGNYEDEPDFDDIDMMQAKDLDLFDKQQLTEQNKLHLTFLQQKQKEGVEEQQQTKSTRSAVAKGDVESEEDTQEDAKEPATDTTTKKQQSKKTSPNATEGLRIGGL